jgi:heterodisulfide reductase subunit A
MIRKKKRKARKKSNGRYHMSDNKLGSVLVIGGGISGMQAAIDIASSGFYVYLVDRSPSIGGMMSKLNKTFPTNDCAM